MTNHGCHAGVELIDTMVPYRVLHSLEYFKDTMKQGGCWPYSAKGYHQIQCNNITASAHRWAYAAFYGKVEKSAVIYHLCDNAKCINPLHLAQGTQAPNIAGMKGKHYPKRSVAAKRLHASGVLTCAHLRDTDRHPCNKAVVSPDGCVYPSAAAAGRALGLTRQAIAARVAAGAWRFA